MANNNPQTGANKPKGYVLEELTWFEAEKLLTKNAVVVIPLGAAAKEHGPHLKLKNDLLIADYLKFRVIQQAEVVVAPTVNYSYYPAFMEYPGSTTLRLETARDLIIDICHSFAMHGPRRFYVINTGVSTIKPLKAAAEILLTEGIILEYTNLGKALDPVERQVRRQEGGTHADEIETSMMLQIAPFAVDMSRAVKDYQPDKGPLTRNPSGNGTYSPTGIWGNPTLATREKGIKLVEALVASVLQDIATLRSKPLPALPAKPIDQPVAPTIPSPTPTPIKPTIKVIHLPVSTLLPSPNPIPSAMPVPTLAPISVPEPPPAVRLPIVTPLPSPTPIPATMPVPTIEPVSVPEPEKETAPPTATPDEPKAPSIPNIVEPEPKPENKLEPKLEAKPEAKPEPENKPDDQPSSEHPNSQLEKSTDQPN